MGKSFWIILSVVVVAGLGLLLFAGSDSGTTNEGGTPEVLSVKENDHKRGLAGSAVTVVEYADFQCPACGASFPTVDQMFKEFGDQVEFVARNFPLISIHPNAMAAHRAAEAASEQDAFWEMHDLLYSRQQSWSSASNPTSIFEGYAQELGLDVDAFREYAASQDALDHINADTKEGTSIGVNGTPTFFINGEQLRIDPRDPAAFRAVIQTALDEANGVTGDAKTTPATETPK